MVAVSQIFDRVKSVALWSANIRKLAKDHKGYGSAAMVQSDLILVFFLMLPYIHQTTIKIHK